jgi:hypothetical protein
MTSCFSPLSYHRSISLRIRDAFGGSGNVGTAITAGNDSDDDNTDDDGDDDAVVVMGCCERRLRDDDGDGDGEGGGSSDVDIDMVDGTGATYRSVTGFTTYRP